MKRLVVVLLLLIIIFLFGKNLNPFTAHFFRIHDTTQYVRISEFYFNIKNAVIPPRLAPHLSFNMGYPLLNFYAPFSYWFASLFSFLGATAVTAFKLSMLCALLLAFVGSTLFLSRYFSFLPALIGALLYTTSPWIASEIFVRGNMGEMWFIALLPFSLFLITILTKYYSPLFVALTALVLSFLFTSHNALSLVGLGLVILYGAVLKTKRNLFIPVVAALLLSAYFWIPFILELPLTYAREVAELTNFSNHFLCISQLWTTPFWGFGGSGPGCIDGMSFMVGKVLLLLATLGIISVFVRAKTIKLKSVYVLFFMMTIGAIFLTSYQSSFVWEIFKPVLSFFQFPWRFIPIALFGLAFFAAHFIDKVRIPFKGVAIVVLLLYILLNNQKYFSYKAPETHSQLYYESAEYKSRRAAFEVPEYFPKTGAYTAWRALENKPITTNYSPSFNKFFSFSRLGTVSIPIHYFPFWKIYVNGTHVVPTTFDTLGRPNIFISGPSTVEVRYTQTVAERIGNVITLMTLLIVSIYATKRNA